jgi:hypothetical protein
MLEILRMIPLTDLWLPILLSAVFVFVVSSVIHMVLPYHKRDCKRLPAEDKVLDGLRGAPPGEYMIPGAKSMKDMCTPEMVAKYKQGPVGNITLMPPGVPSIGRSLVQWFLYSLLIGVFTAYLGSVGLDRGANYLKVFQLTGGAAVALYAFASIPNSIWKGTPWATTLKFVFDGVVYGLVTAGTFGWLWPKS